MFLAGVFASGSQAASSPYPIIFIPGLGSASYDFGYYSEYQWNKSLISRLVDDGGYKFGASFYWPRDSRSNGNLLAWTPGGESGQFDVPITIYNLASLRGDLYTFTFPVESQIEGNTFIDMADDLALVINIVKAINNTDKVILVGRSKGGLVAKAYLQNKHYRGDVAMFVSVGTPFLGSSIADSYETARHEVPTGNNSFSAFVRGIYDRPLKYFTVALLHDYLQPYWQQITVSDLRPLAAETLISDATDFMHLPADTIYFCLVYEDIVHDVYGDGDFIDYIHSFDREGKAMKLNNGNNLDILPDKGGDSIVNVLSQNLRCTQAGWELGPEKIMTLFCGAASPRASYPLHLQETSLSVTYSQLIRALRWTTQPTLTPTPTMTSRPTATPTVTPTPSFTPTPTVTPIPVTPEVMQAYRNRLADTLSKAWVPPNDPMIKIWFWMEDHLYAETKFYVQKNGMITNIILTKSAGWDSVDDSILAAIQSVSPFGPLPVGYQGQYIEVNMGFTLWLR
jgi:pimeloyl-ACP methyl ester carboxylesterase